MATINYTTLRLPETVWEYSEKIQDTPNFEVRRCTHKKGVIFRLPHGAQVGQTHHAFMEHEINLSNTLRTGTLTMKIQITFIPCHIGVFSGFETLKGQYGDDFDYDDDYWGYEYFKPDYESPENIKNIIPLPPNMKTNLYEYLNEIIFNHVSDADVISDYAIDLGCQKKVIKDRLVPIPVQTSQTEKGTRAFHQTVNFFDEITSGTGSNLLKE
jgi:hypothetical protein